MMIHAPCSLTKDEVMLDAPPTAEQLALAREVVKPEVVRRLLDTLNPHKKAPHTLSPGVYKELAYFLTPALVEHLEHLTEIQASGQTPTAWKGSQLVGLCWGA
eukprot:5161335-Amphidinium_carterae.3